MRFTRRGFLRLGAAGAVAGVSTGVYAFGIEPVWMRTVEQEVRLRRLDPLLAGLTVVQLSDLHVGAGVPLDYLRDAVAVANAAQPDLVALTGDFVHRGGDSRHADEVGELVAGLKARMGVFAVLGNHDADVYGTQKAPDRRSMEWVRGALTGAGCTVLENERVTVERGGAKLHVAGMGDLWTSAFHPDTVPLRDHHVPTLALSHNPDTAPALAAHGCDLILSGHTHGGQVSIPFMGPPILPIAHREYAAGLFDLGGAQLYVNRGLGWLRRVRMFVRPEVTVLRLVGT